MHLLAADGCSYIPTLERSASPYVWVVDFYILFFVVPSDAAYYSMFALILQVGTCRALHSKCHPRHFFIPKVRSPRVRQLKRTELARRVESAQCLRSPHSLTQLVGGHKYMAFFEKYGCAFWVCHSLFTLISKLLSWMWIAYSIDTIYYFSKKMLALLAYVHFL